MSQSVRVLKPLLQALDDATLTQTIMSESGTKKRKTLIRWMKSLQNKRSSQKPRPRHMSGMRMDSCLGRVVEVPESYFGSDGGMYYSGKVKKWGTFYREGDEGDDGKELWGYEVYFPIDKETWWLLESEVVDYLVDETTTTSIGLRGNKIEFSDRD